MIMFWRRREVLLTYSMEERARVCDALAANGIDYEVFVKDLSARQWDRPGTLGINMNAAIEYKVTVDKDDYDEACYVAFKKGERALLMMRLSDRRGSI